MTFSIRTTIRALVAPEHRINCPRQLWDSIMSELERRGEGSHESGAFLLGSRNGRRSTICDTVFYDDLDPAAYDTGACILRGDAFAKLWGICRERGLTVVADVHTHGRDATQSYADRMNPMIARVGHIAIIVPDLARLPINITTLGLYEFRGNYDWTNHSGAAGKNFLYMGFWS